MSSSNEIERCETILRGLEAKRANCVKHGTELASFDAALKAAGAKLTAAEQAKVEAADRVCC
jgi:hypothetical protein